MAKNLKKQEKIKDLLKRNIKDIGFSIKVCRALEEAGYSTVLDIITKFEDIESLYNVPGIGKTLANEIIEKIHSLELSFSYESISRVEAQSEKARQKSEPMTLEEKGMIEEIDYTLKSFIEFLIKNYEYFNKQLEKYQKLSDELLRQLEMSAIQAGYSDRKMEFMKKMIKEKSESLDELKIIAEAMKQEEERRSRNEAERTRLNKEYKKLQRKVKKLEDEILENEISRMCTDGTIEIDN